LAACDDRAKCTVACSGPPERPQTAPDAVAGTDVYFDKHTCGQPVDDIFKVVVP
jgi:hypothetical protein